MDLTSTLGLDAARLVDPARYAMSGRAPRVALKPITREEVGEALRAASGDGLGVVPWGGGVALARERAPERYDLALDLRALDRIVEFEPGDLTLTAECGVTLEALREAVGLRGLDLPLEAGEAWGATLGGVLAANASGARRLAIGAPRDRILGARFAIGDGTIARSGGKVVKNVAGYGIHRLLCGSRGAIGVILEASLKLLPAPETRTAMVFALEAAQLANAALWSRFPRLEPAVLTIVGRAAADLNPVLAHRTAFTAIVGFEGEAPHVDDMCRLTREALGTPRLKLPGQSAATLWQALADLEELQGPRLSFAGAHNTPAALAPLLKGRLLERAVLHAPFGRLHLFPEQGADSGATLPAATAEPLVRDLHAHGFALIGARGVEPFEPPLPPQVAVGALRGSIRAALDPSSTMALGAAWARG